MQRIQLTDETYTNQPPIAEVIERAAHPHGPQPNGKIPFVEPDFEIVDPADVEGMRRARGFAANPRGKLPIVNVRRTRERGSLIELDGALELNEKNARAAAKASSADSATPTPAGPKMGGRDGWIQGQQAEVRGHVHAPATPSAQATDAAPRMSGRDAMISKQQCEVGEGVLLPQELGQ
ncbi:MAG: hypothetical protein WCG85_23075 [Polyangia bacterium]